MRLIGGVIGLIFANREDARDVARASAKNGSCHAFDGFRAHVAYGKYPAPRRLQWMATRAGILARQDEAPRVESNASSAEPVRIGLGTDKQKQMADRSPDFPASGAKSPANGLQHTAIAFKTTDGGARHHFHIAEGMDAIDQITRNRLREMARD
jgi:hypothetical protein